MGKACVSAVGIGIAGAVVGMHVYMFMSPKSQRHLKKGLNGVVDDLKDITERLREV